MIISFDLDGVLLSYTKGFGDWLDSKGFKVPRDRITNDYNFSDWNLNQDVLRLYQEFRWDGGLLNLELIEPDAPQVIKNLLAAGHDVIFNSSRGADLLRDSLEFYDTFIQTFNNLKSHGFPVNVYNLHIGMRDKSLLAFNYHIDDHTKTLEQISHRDVICYNQPYNQDYQGQRIFNLKEVLKLCM